MLEVAQGGQRVLHDLVTGLTGHGRDECDTAGVVLERWSYRPLAGIMGTPGLGSTDRRTLSRGPRDAVGPKRHQHNPSVRVFVASREGCARAQT